MNAAPPDALPPASSPTPASGSKAVVPPAQTPKRDLLTMLAVGVVIVSALYVGREIILPVVLAIILAFVLTPIVNVLRRAHRPRRPRSWSR